MELDFNIQEISEIEALEIRGGFKDANTYQNCTFEECSHTNCQDDSYKVCGHIVCHHEHCGCNIEQPIHSAEGCGGTPSNVTATCGK